jgi:replicative DNA helicase
MTNLAELETAVLAAALRDHYFLAQLIDEGFWPELLHVPAARLAAANLLFLGRDAHSPVDLPVLKARLEENGALTEDIRSLLDSVAKVSLPTLDQLMTYVELLKDRDSRVRLFKLGGDLQSYAKQPSDLGADRTVMNFAASAVDELLKIQNQRLRKRVTPAAAIVQQICKEIENRPAEKLLLGYSLAPFQHLSNTLSGLRPGFYYAIAGAPRRGKTNLALQLASNVATNHHIPVIFISWEQTRKVLTARLIARGSGLNPTSLLTEDISRRPQGLERLARGLKGVQQYAGELYIIEGSRHHTIDRIRAIAYNVMHEFRSNSVVIFLDYLQKVPLAKPASDTRSRIDEISTGLADLSLDLNCPVVTISSLDKEGCRLDDEITVEDTGVVSRPRPTMHNCTGSGDIEYDVDVAMILSKDWHATKELRELLKSKADGGLVPHIDIIDLYVDKNRDAPQEAGQAIQYAFFVYENRFVELGFKSEEEYKAEFKGFAQIQELYAFLVEHGDLAGSDASTTKSIGIFASGEQ